MLKGQQFVNTVNFDKQVAIQVNHLVKPHHPDTVFGSIDRNFVQNIESKRNASLQYFSKMKALQADQLDKGLMQYQKMKQVTQVEKENDRRDYRERVNGVLGDIERNMMNRDRMFQSQLFRQSEKQKGFIDENAIKEMRISQHINRNVDINLFNHESDRYQKYQNMEHSQTLKTMGIQRQEIQRKREDQKVRKEMQVRKREEYERQLEQQRLARQQEKMRNREQYQMDLQKLVEEKNEANKKKPQPVVDLRRHNPITNPLQYRIDNPYFLKRLEKYQ